MSAVAEFDPGAQRLRPHLHDRGRRPLRLRSGRHSVERARRRSGVACAASCASRRARPTTPKLVEKSTEEMTIEMSKRGYAFAQVRPRGDRNFETRQINVVFVVEEGARAYIERINVRGNTRTRDYVIRREFDIAEGDAYNRVLVDRAERRLKNLNYFKIVKITNEPGSAPDRIILNVDVEEQSTGEFSIAGGYSTADGFDRRSLGRRTQPARPRPDRARMRSLRPAHARRRILVRRAVLPRLSARVRHRRVRQADRCVVIVRLPAGDDRRRLPLRHPAARGPRAPAALLGLSAADRPRSDAAQL